MRLHTSKIRRTMLFIAAVAAVAAAGVLIGRSTVDSPKTNITTVGTEVISDDTVWTCSMHPQIRQPGPGQCPICGMDLIPVEDASTDADGAMRTVTLSPAAEKLAGIQVVPVERRAVEKRLATVGTVAFDESRVSYISSWVPGRIERLYVDYTGITVREGDHLVDIYSPELYSAQEEYIQSMKTGAMLSGSELESGRRTSSLTVEAAREKLRLLGMTPDQIASLEDRGRPTEQVTIFSPSGGVVVHRNATTGMYVKTGEKIYTVADLTRVWVMLDMYESDLQWVRYGQEVTFTAESYPGRTFTGRIAFIDPVVDERSRTVKVRVNVPNNALELKPNMFVEAAIRSRIAEGGRVMDPALAGKYMCPMHPSVVHDIPDDCPICGMDLVSTESLGYAVADTGTPPLTIPRTAPLITGKRAVVYVRKEEPGVYEGREVVLGPRAGEWYEVAEGLAEGEMVVVNGAFKLDSSLQIQARPSMMSPVTGTAAPAHHSEGSGTAHGATGHDLSLDDGHAGVSGERAAGATIYGVPDAFIKQLDGVYNAYFDIRAALSHDDHGKAATAADGLLYSLKIVDMALLDHDAHTVWMPLLGRLRDSAGGIAAAEGLKKARTSFEPLSRAVIEMADSFGHAEGTMYLFHCPMAFDNEGADWMQETPELENPYFGSSMLTCGSLVSTYSE